MSVQEVCDFRVGVSDLFVLYLQRRQAGLQLREAEVELGLDLRLGRDLGHLTGSQTTTGQSGNHCHNFILAESGFHSTTLYQAEHFCGFTHNVMNNQNVTKSLTLELYFPFLKYISLD